MRFKLSICKLLLMIPLTYTSHLMAETNPPIDLIELLGEMGDDENMLEIALSELQQSTSQPQQSQDNKQNHKQNSEIATSVGGGKK